MIIRWALIITSTLNRQFFLSWDEGSTWYSMRDGVAHKSSFTANWCFLFHESRISCQISRVSCQKGPTRHALRMADRALLAGYPRHMHMCWWWIAVVVSSGLMRFIFTVILLGYISCLMKIIIAHTPEKSQRDWYEEWWGVHNHRNLPNVQQYSYLFWGTVDKSDPSPPRHYQILLTKLFWIIDIEP